LSEENKAADGLEQSLDSGVDTALAAGAAYDAAQNIGAAAASAGQAAAQSAAAAGAASGVAAGTGAAAGTAVGGSAGTVLGAVIGLAVGLVAKPAVKGVIVIAAFLMMVFSSLPSMFFEQPADMADNTGPETVYRQFKDYVQQAYEQEIEKQKLQIEAAFQARVALGEFSGYDHVTYTFSFDPAEDVFLAEVRDACVLIIAMFEIHTDDWREASFDHFKKAVDSVSFWNDTVEAEKLSESYTVTWSGGGSGEDDEEEDDPESTIHVEMTYRFHDKGVEQFRKKFGLQDDAGYLKSIEMAYNTRIFFGESAGLPMGGVSVGASGSYPGGGTHNTIREALAGQEEREFFGGEPEMPIRDYRSVSSEFGPRNYAPDPLHTGIDFSADVGVPVYAAMDGVVLLRLTSMSTFGHHIVLYHGGGVTTMYAHLSAFGSFRVGEEVKCGDIIGYVGSTGLSTGPHLHFEYQKNGAAYNPRTVLPF